MKNTPYSSLIPAFFLGIDVGKPDLFCHAITPERNLKMRFDNTPEGIQLLLAWIASIANPELFAACLEQTGHYGRAISRALADAKLSAVYLVNPRQIKAYGEQQLRRNKSDSADARLIAQFLQSEYSKLLPWCPPGVDNEQVKELSRYADSITQDNASLKTKCDMLEQPAVLRSLKRRIKAQEKEIEDIRRRISKIIDGNEVLRRQFELLISAPGIGEVTGQILIAELPELDLFGNARQLAAWAGVTPRHYVSGTSGRSATPITKIGSAYLRRALFMPAMNARMFNPLLKSFADRLKENGKKPKQIIIAVMRKLLHQIYGILKSGTPYNPEKRGFCNAR